MINSFAFNQSSQWVHWRWKCPRLCVTSASNRSWSSMRLFTRSLYTLFLWQPSPFSSSTFWLSVWSPNGVQFDRTMSPHWSSNHRESITPSTDETTRQKKTLKDTLENFDEHRHHFERFFNIVFFQLSILTSFPFQSLHCSRSCFPLRAGRCS